MVLKSAHLLYVEQNEAKTDAKIDMLHQFGAFANKSRTKRTAVEDESFDSVQSGYTEQTDTTESVVSLL